MISSSPKSVGPRLQHTVRWPADRGLGNAEDLGTLAARFDLNVAVVQAESRSGRLWFLELPDQADDCRERHWVGRKAWAALDGTGAPIAQRMDGKPWNLTGEMSWDLTGGDRDS